MSLIDGLPQPVRVLDVGGTPAYWQRMEPSAAGLDVTVLNTSADANAGVEQRIGDARRMPEFDDREFDVVFSNSVIEHVGGPADQRAMAEEVSRVGRGYFVQTPNRWFPLEPHFLVPGFQFLPAGARIRLLQRFDLGHIRRRPDRAEAEREVRSIRLLDAGDLRRLFPDASLYRERALGLTKSLMAARRPA